jgi:hypothetical protein
MHLQEGQLGPTMLPGSGYMKAENRPKAAFFIQ